MNDIDIKLLKEIADLEKVPQGAYNIRKNSASAGRAVTANIDITTKTDKSGIDIRIKPGTVGESVHIPVILTETGLKETVYNDFYIGENSDVLIIAGCGIHNGGCETSQHDGVHTFYVEKNAKVRYIEKHYGEGEGTGERVMNPETVVYLGEGAFMQMDTTQIRGVDSTRRTTRAVVGKNAEFVINEKLMTHGRQKADSRMEIILEGEDSSGKVTSRSVAKDESEQVFYPDVKGRARCFGHVRCDSILMDGARIRSIPAISAEHPEASLTHEAAIGRIAGEQLEKLMTFGLSEEEAEEKILEGFLR